MKQMSHCVFTKTQKQLFAIKDAHGFNFQYEIVRAIVRQLKQTMCHFFSKSKGAKKGGGWGLSGGSQTRL